MRTAILAAIVALFTSAMVTGAYGQEADTCGGRGASIASTSDTRPADAAPYFLVPWNSAHGAATEPSALNFTSAVWVVSLLEDAVVGDRLVEPCGRHRGARLAGRLVRAFVFDIWITGWFSNVQHEYFGHRGRALELGAPVGRIRLHSFWGTGGGYDADLSRLNDTGRLVVNAGGSEANTVWAEESVRRAMAPSQVYYAELPATLLKVDLPLYALGGDTPRPEDPAWRRKADEGWDVASYLDGFQYRSDRSLRALYDATRRGAWWSLSDPRLMASLYSYLVHYVLEGRRQAPFPMLSAGGLRFIPGTSFHLSPFGPEYLLSLHVKRGHRLLSVYGRRAIGHRDGSGEGMGGEGRGIVRRRRLVLDVRADAWRQPDDLGLARDADASRRRRVGANIETRVVVPAVKDAWGVGLIGELGYKTRGFVAGRPLSAGAYGYLGVAVRP
jgi:hypothetical protein